MSYSIAPGFTTFLCGVLAIVFMDALNAEMCKWVDKDGCVHYAETCPEGVESSTVEIQAPPPAAQLEEAAKRSADVQAQQSGREELPSEPPDKSTLNFDQMRDRCIEARLSLEVLSQGLPIYYDSQGHLQAELWNYPNVRFERSKRYLDADAIKRDTRHWSLVKQDNCTGAVAGSGIRAEIKKKKKGYQQQKCEVWQAELEYMERSKGFHDERMELKRLFNAKCK